MKRYFPLALHHFWLTTISFFLLTTIAFAQSQSLTIEEYEPKSTLVTKEHRIERAKFPFVDIHSHHNNPSPADVDKLVKEMDSINMRVMVNLSGGTGERLKQNIAVMKGRYPGRFVVF